MIPATIIKIQKRCEKTGWIMNPRNAAGNRYAHHLQYQGNGWNVMASFNWPHSSSMVSEGSIDHCMSAVLCKGKAPGGVLIHQRSITDLIPFMGEHISPEQWTKDCLACLAEMIAYGRQVAGETVKT